MQITFELEEKETHLSDMVVTDASQQVSWQSPAKRVEYSFEIEGRRHNFVLIFPTKAEPVGEDEKQKLIRRQFIGAIREQK